MMFTTIVTVLGLVYKSFCSSVCNRLKSCKGMEIKLAVVVGVVRIHSPSIRHSEQKNCCNQNCDVKFQLDFSFDPTATNFCKPKEQSKPVIIRIHHTVGSDLVNALEIGEA